MKAMRATLLLAASLGGCIGADPEVVPDAGLPPAERRAVAVSDVANEAPSARVAEVTGATTAMLRALLERTRRVEVLAPVAPGLGGPPGYDLRVDASITDLRDEPAGDGAEPGAADPADLRRRAVVTMSYSVLARDGRTLAEGTLTGEWVRPGDEPAKFPSAADRASGAYWVAPFGRATRACLDQLVGIIAALP
jgi:hypothetical protein